MVTRRNFLKASAAALPIMAFGGSRAFAAEHIPLGLQLYTVRNQVQSGLPALLKQIRGVGYEEVEAYSGLYSLHPAGELRSMILDAGLKVPAGHWGYTDLPGGFDYAKQLGLSWILCSMIPKEQWTSDGFRTAAKQFNDWGKRAKEMGMRFAFHNHDYEFKPLDGKTGYDILIEETDPTLVSFEVDLYWVAQSGTDPLQLLHRLGHRARLLHLKDRKPGFPPSFDMGASSAHFAEVGNGNLPWKPILEFARRNHVDHYFVEQDKTDGNPIDSITMSYKYLRTLLP